MSEVIDEDVIGAPGAWLGMQLDLMLIPITGERYFYTAWDGTHRRWRYTDDERPSDARCYDCTLPLSLIHI